MLEKNIIASIEEVQNNLEMRDYIDSNREFSPLRKADDAKILDNSLLTREEQLELAFSWAMEKLMCSEVVIYFIKDSYKCL